jgi:uncharacterized protein DUF1549/uncharacterized protein DUF1553
MHLRVALLVVLAAQGVSGREVSFRNDVMAVLSKAGCNAGTCHGNKNGKGGFKLSLRGENPQQDYHSLTRDIFSRRVEPVQPEASLILLKPTTAVAHEGGQRFKPGSQEYAILKDWIAAQMPNDLDTAPGLKRIEVSPSERVLVEPAREMQLQVRAEFSDGTSRDITSMAVYEPATPLVEISPAGRVRGKGSGESTVLVRYLNCQEPLRLAFVPARPEFTWKKVAANNYIDEQVLAKLKLLRMNPSELSSDAVFLRRAYLDLLGILPSVDETKTFLQDRNRNKRARLIDELLERPEYADFWALKWADLLRVEAHSLDHKGVQNFHHWIRQSVAENKPLDQFAREILFARGSTYRNPAANYYRPNRNATTRAKATAQVFLGTRLQCAECHNHPHERWTQDDYYDWAALFVRVNYKVIENKRDISSDEHEWKGEQVIFPARAGAVKNVRTGKDATPRFLGERNCESGPDLSGLATWLTTNRAFARVQVNRIWFHLMGRGLVDPPDDFRATNPASHPQLLDALADDFVKHKFDVRHLIRLIMTSRAYQLSSEPNETNAGDEINYSHTLVRRLGAEQLLDCQSQVADVPLKFNGYPRGMRAAQLPGVRPEAKGQRRANQLDRFLELFGKPPRLLTTDTERSCECNMGQAFQLISGPAVNQMLSENENRITRLIGANTSNREMLEKLFWTALTRPPTEKELAELLPRLDGAKDVRAELEDVLWGLLNSKEFVFRW